MERVVVGFSGGVDSVLVAVVCREVLGRENVLAVTAVSPAIPQSELNAAAQMAEKLDLQTRLIMTHELTNPDYTKNPIHRCYVCRSELFSRLSEIASTEGFKWVVDGSTHDDLRDYRPGHQAKKDYRVRSPLQEAHLSKHEIRELSKQYRLPGWDKPSSACLSSRIPYGEEITNEKLKRIEAAEEFLRSLGFKQVRVRHYKELARIEIPEEELASFMQPPLRHQIITTLEKLGFVYVTLDLKGFRSGSMNEVLKIR